MRGGGGDRRVGTTGPRRGNTPGTRKAEKTDVHVPMGESAGRSAVSACAGASLGLFVHRPPDCPPEHKRRTVQTTQNNALTVAGEGTEAPKPKHRPLDARREALTSGPQRFVNIFKDVFLVPRVVVSVAAPE